MKRRFAIIPLLLIILVVPTYANFIYSRTYYGNEAKITNQYDTGSYGYVSCMPTAIKMLLDYQGVKSESVSTMFCKMSGNSYGVNVLNGIEYVNSLPTSFALTQFIENKNTFMFYTDMNIPYLLIINPLNINMQGDDKISAILKPIGKDYRTYENSIHTIAIIGYVKIDDKLWLEVLDPLSRQVLYYDADNVIESLEWNCLITVQRVEDGVDEKD